MYEQQQKITFHELLVSLSLSGLSKSFSIPEENTNNRETEPSNRQFVMKNRRCEEDSRSGARAWTYGRGRCCGRPWGHPPGRRSPPTSRHRRRRTAATDRRSPHLHSHHQRQQQQQHKHQHLLLLFLRLLSLSH